MKTGGERRKDGEKSSRRAKTKDGGRKKIRNLRHSEQLLLLKSSLRETQRGHSSSLSFTLSLCLMGLIVQAHHKKKEKKKNPAQQEKSLFYNNLLKMPEQHVQHVHMHLFFKLLKQIFQTALG